MRVSGDGGDADGRLPIFLRMQGVRSASEAAGRRLLRLLQLRHSPLPADPGKQSLLLIARPKASAMATSSLNRSAGPAGTARRLSASNLQCYRFGGDSAGNGSSRWRDMGNAAAGPAARRHRLGRCRARAALRLGRHCPPAPALGRRTPPTVPTGSMNGRSISSSPPPRPPSKPSRRRDVLARLPPLPAAAEGRSRYRSPRAGRKAASDGSPASLVVPACSVPEHEHG